MRERGRLNEGVVLAGIVAIALAMALPYDSWWRVGVKCGLGWAVGWVMYRAVRRHPPRVRAPWLCFAVGIVLNATGVLAERVTNEIVHEDAQPVVADFFWLALYPALVAGIALLIRNRARHRDRSPLVDAVTISTGLGLLSWVFLVRPILVDENDSLMRAIAIAYPVGDFVVLAMLVRLLLGADRRNASFVVMVLSLLAFLFGDLSWALASHLGVDPPTIVERSLDATFLVAYVLFGVAARLVSVVRLQEPAVEPPFRFRRWHLALLACASLTAPAVLAGEAIAGEVTDGIAIAVCCTVSFLLVLLRMAQLVRQVAAQAEELNQLARVDELTGLLNRRAWNDELEGAMQRARREKARLVVALMDLDHFKWFNDTNGHLAGDLLLRSAAAAWQAELREADRLCRFGGEEFIVLFGDSAPEELDRAIDRLRSVTPGSQTFSCGVATWDGIESPEELIDRADHALYVAKATGRNRTAHAPASTTRPAHFRA